MNKSNSDVPCSGNMPTEAMATALGNKAKENAQLNHIVNWAGNSKDITSAIVIMGNQIAIKSHLEVYFTG